MWWLVYCYMFIFSFGLTFVLVPLCRKLAPLTGFVSNPHPDKMGETPVPLLGGLAIYAGFTLTVALHFLFLSLFRNTSLVELVPDTVLKNIPGVLAQSKKLLAFLFGGMIIFLVGLIDDRWEMKPLVKLACQVGVAFFIAVCGIKITFFIRSDLLSTLATVLWIVTVINAFNFFDNMDGLCAGVAAIASIFFFFTSATMHEFFISLMLTVIAGSLLAFLRFNFSPASIYMGDAGSMFIGYVLASLTVLATYYSTSQQTFFPVILPVIVLAVPLYDLAVVMLMRVRRGLSVFKASPHHFSFRLLSLGMSVRNATLMIYLITFCTGLAAVLLPHVGTTGAVLVLIQVMVILIIIGLLERHGRSK
jgi:UDP-GlcNAc:undecaprenyl-phosphate/decaprenyl-phosphate GlcNAc-1-phosphate transferase